MRSLPFTSSNGNDESATLIILSRSMLTGTSIPFVDIGSSNSNVEIFCALQTDKQAKRMRHKKIDRIISFIVLHIIPNQFISLLRLPVVLLHRPMFRCDFQGAILQRKFYNYPVA